MDSAVKKVQEVLHLSAHAWLTCTLCAMVIRPQPTLCAGLDRTEIIERIVAGFVEASRTTGEERVGFCVEWGEVSYCLGPKTDARGLQAFLEGLSDPDPVPKYDIGTRWDDTATNPSIPQYTPFTLTYSFVPDGTPIPAKEPLESADPCNLHAAFDAAFGGNRADCQAFIAALNALGQGTFRLPSEAEWEYACRAGSTTRFYFGDSLSCLDDCADCGAAKGVIFIEMRSEYMWFCGNRGISTQTVRQLLGNSFGLYDMAGNLAEWCQDSSHADYTGAPTDGSAWETDGSSNRVFRGGSWSSFARNCRSAFRVVGDPRGRDYNYGFRLARTP